MTTGPQRPGDGCATDFEDRFNLIKQFHRIASFAIHLVDKGHDGCVPQATNIHQFDRTLFNAFRRINHHQGGVHCGQRAVRVFRKVSMARRIQQVHNKLAVLELHDRRGDRDTPLLFKLHPVGSGIPTRLAGAHGSRLLNSAAVMEEFLSEGCLTRVRVRNDGKGASALHLFQMI